MPAALNATITITGDPAQLQEYRRKVNELLALELAEDYRELHTGAQLDYRFKLKGGIPFPPFVDASVDFPELLVRVEWDRPAQGVKGAATIQNGSLKEQSGESSARSGGSQAWNDLRVAADGRLQLGLACRAWRAGELIGYALTSGQHAYFHLAFDGERAVLTATDGVDEAWAERWTVSDGHAQYLELGDGEAIDKGMLQELEKLARDFVEDWIWFAAGPAEDTVVERQRYENYGLTMNEANVRSQKLRSVMQTLEGGGYVFTAEHTDAARARELLERCWVQEG